MRIPAPLRDTARAIGLRDWVRDKRFPFDDYCATIDGAYDIIRRHQPADDADDPTYEQVVPVIAQALDAEGALIEHCGDKGFEVPDDETWTRVLRAAAWTILQRYALAVRNGDWTPGG